MHAPENTVILQTIYTDAQTSENQRYMTIHKVIHYNWLHLRCQRLGTMSENFENDTQLEIV